MNSSTRKPLMRSLGEFVGHIVKAVKTNPTKEIVRREVEQEQRGGVTLRRTTIEEIEINPKLEREPNESGRDDRATRPS